MSAPERFRLWSWVVIVTILSGAIPAASTSQRSFHARFEPFDAAEGPVPLFIDGFESAGTCEWLATAPCTLYIVTIPPNTGAGIHAFPALIHVQVGTVLHIVNGDATPHRIHAVGLGLQHQAFSMTQGQEYVGTVSDLGSDVIYCHDHLLDSGSMTVLSQ